MIKRMSWRMLALAVAGGIAASPALAAADDKPGYVRLGLTRIAFVDGGALKADGAAIPGAAYDTDPRITATVEAGYFVTSAFSLSVSGTLPAKSKNIADGSLKGVGNLGSDDFSLFTATALYHLNRGGVMQPYVGGGIAYQATWDSDDGAVQNLDISDAHGPVVQGGLEVRVSERVGVYVDAKKAWLKNNATGSLGPSAITARPVLNPFILQAGASFHF